MSLKRFLLTTTAAAGLATASGMAAAAEWSVEVGGFMNQYFGYAESDVADGDGFSQVTDSEIYFQSELTVDNGLTFGFQVQLEGEEDGDQIDQNFLYVTGAFGAVYLGGEASAPALMSYDVPSAGIGLDSGDAADWIAGVNNDLISTVGNFTKDEDAAGKISYFSPRFAGFQVGVSYVPDVAEDVDDPPDNNDGTLDNAVGVAMNYDNTFGDFVIQASAAYMHFGDDDALADSPTDFGFGLRLGYGPVLVGGSYNNLDDSGAGDIESFGFGAVYTGGPFSASLAYIYGEDDATNTDSKAFELGATYELGPGVAALGSFYYVDQDAPAGGGAEGLALVGGIALTF